MYWFYSTLILVAWMFTFLPMELGIATVGLVNGIWHFDFAKSQIEYINKKIDDVYERKSWRQPVGNATACLILAVMFKIDLASHVCR
ncbi:MAG: hypothetical protein D4S02_17785 [Rhodocyclaceae bacterium]|nr:MAG: hypothetical protein D4S02_17785 [Rhodocyclaceae bacterium]